MTLVLIGCASRAQAANIASAAPNRRAAFRVEGEWFLVGAVAGDVPGLPQGARLLCEMRDLASDDLDDLLEAPGTDARIAFGLGVLAARRGWA